MRFLDLAATSAAVAATSARKAKVELLADALRRLEPDEIAAGSAYLAGELPQRQTGVGYAGLRDRPEPAAEPTLTVGAVDAAIAAIVVGGAAVGGVGRRDPLVRDRCRLVRPDRRLRAAAPRWVAASSIAASPPLDICRNSIAGQSLPSVSAWT